MSEQNQYGDSASQWSLPFSQESYVTALLNQMDCPLTHHLTNVTGLEFPRAEEFPSMLSATDFSNVQEFTSMVQGLGNSFSSLPVPSMLARQPDTPEQNYVPSSLPASVTWPGKYSFDVFFNAQGNIKGATWIYSVLNNKLYVGKDVSCPINFSTSCSMPTGVHIRAMAYFSSAADASYRVHRCVNHSMDEIQRGIFEAEHLVRCESTAARYEIDAAGHHSVVVPFENPSAGQYFSTYIYKFACLTSCSGGPNRRPLMLVFTLENGSDVIGRYKLDLRVCSSPRRDMTNEEKQLHPKRPTMQMKHDDPVSSKVQQKTSMKVKKQGQYFIKVQDRKCYKFLKYMKKYYHAYQNFQGAMSPKDLKFFLYTALSSSEDELHSSQDS